MTNTPRTPGFFVVLTWITLSGPSQGLKIRGGGLVVLGGNNVSPLVKIGLADLPNACMLKPPSPHLATALTYICP